MNQVQPLTLYRRNRPGLKLGKSGIAMFSGHVSLHTIFPREILLANRTRPTHVNSIKGWRKLTNCAMFHDYIDLHSHNSIVLSQPPPPPPPLPPSPAPPPSPPQFYCSPYPLLCLIFLGNPGMKGEKVSFVGPHNVNIILNALLDKPFVLNQPLSSAKSHNSY